MYFFFTISHDLPFGKSWALNNYKGVAVVQLLTVNGKKIPKCREHFGLMGAKIYYPLYNIPSAFIYYHDVSKNERKNIINVRVIL